MSLDTDFYYTKNGLCQYKIGQKIPEFAPMNYELKFSFNKTSLDIIIGLALVPNEVTNFLNDNWLHIGLFFYKIIPSLVITTGKIQVAGNIVFNDYDKINIEEWLQSTDDYVNLVVANVHHEYEVKELRRIKLPLMSKIREVLKEQVLCTSESIENVLKIIKHGFFIPWMVYYTDEECHYIPETAEAQQKGVHIINDPKEKKIHVYY